MHSGAFATRMLLGFRDYNVKCPFNFVEFALFFCSFVLLSQEKEIPRRCALSG